MSHKQHLASGTGSARNTGYVSIGHILALKSKKDFKKTLRHFLTLIFVNLNDDVVNKDSGFWRYDQFFKSVEINVNSFAKFLGGIIRKPDTSEIEFQQHIEQIAWDMVKIEYEKTIGSEDQLNRKCLFRLFCIFNRLCHTETCPDLLIAPKPLTFLFRRIGVALPQTYVDEGLNFTETINALLKCNQNAMQTLRILIKRLYDELVRDVLRETRCKCKVIRKGASSQSGSGQKIVTVSNSCLTVFDDAPHDNWEQPHNDEPTGKIICQIPVLTLDTKLTRASLFNKESTLRIFSTTDVSAPKVDLAFDDKKESYELFAWGQAIREGKDNMTNNTNRLKKYISQYELNNDVIVKSSPNSRLKLRPSLKSQSSVDLRQHITRIFISGKDSEVKSTAEVPKSSENSCTKPEEVEAEVETDSEQQNPRKSLPKRKVTRTKALSSIELLKESSPAILDEINETETGYEFTFKMKVIKSTNSSSSTSTSSILLEEDEDVFLRKDSNGCDSKLLLAPRCVSRESFTDSGLEL